MTQRFDSEVAWLAGLLEGEGSFVHTRLRRAPRGIYHYARVQLSMTDRDVVERAVEVVGRLCGKRVNIYSRARHSKEWKPIYQICWHGETALSVMKAVRPFMGHRRGAAIDALLSQFDQRREARAS